MMILPAVFPASMRMDAIECPRVRALLAEEKELRERRAAIREAQRKLQDERAKALTSHMPKVERFNTEMNSTIDALSSRKDAILLELDQIKRCQGDLAQLRQELQLADYDMANLTKSLREAELLLQDETRELNRLREARRGKHEAAALSAADERLAAQLRRVEKLRTALETAASQHKTRDAARIALRERFAAAEAAVGARGDREARNARFAALRASLASVSKELGDAIRARRERRPLCDGLDALRAAHDAQSDALRELERRADALRAALPFRTFSYPPSHKMALVGRGGATLAQLQEDFHAAVCVDAVAAGAGFVIGADADCAAVCAAVAAIVAAAEAEDAHEVTIPLSSEPLRRRLIGAGGANVRRVERESGARVHIADGAVTLRGTGAAVAAAQSQIEAFLAAQHTAELAVAAVDIPHVIGKEGAVIRRVERETGVRSVHVDRRAQRIVLSGEMAAVEEAARRYRDLLEDIRRSSFTMRCEDESVTRRLLGPGGRTIREMERTTGAVVRVEGATISVRGTSEAAAAARKMIQELRRGEARVPLDAAAMHLVTAAIVEVGKGLPPRTDPTATATAEEKEKEEEEEEAPMTLLQAIREATQCEVVAPLRAEGVVLLRGKESQVNQARVMLKDFALRFHPHAVRVAFPEVLFSYLTARPSGKAPSPITQLSTSRSPLLRVQLQREAEVAVVSSPLAEEAEAAAAALRVIIAEKETCVRRVLDFPAYRIGALMGHGSRSLKELEERTGTRVLVRRSTNEVQVFHPNADTAALDEAVEAIEEVAKK